MREDPSHVQPQWQHQDSCDGCRDEERALEHYAHGHVLLRPIRLRQVMTYICRQATYEGFHRAGSWRVSDAPDRTACRERWQSPPSATSRKLYRTKTRARLLIAPLPTNAPLQSASQQDGPRRCMVRRSVTRVSLPSLALVSHSSNEHSHGKICRQSNWIILPPCVIARMSMLTAT